MAFLEFTPALELKVRAMDEEHKKLIALMNRLHELRASETATHSPTGRIQVARTLGDLVAYTKEHFAHEEAYMASIAYAKRDLHMDIHRRLLEELVKLSVPFERGGQLGDDFFNFLKMWLVSHIKGVDRQYADSVGASGSGPSAPAKPPSPAPRPAPAGVAPRPAAAVAPAARPAAAPAPRPASNGAPPGALPGARAAAAPAPMARPPGIAPRRP